MILERYKISVIHYTTGLAAAADSTHWHHAIQDRFIFRQILIRDVLEFPEIPEIISYTGGTR
jgi:hypothetical protein